MPKICLQRLLEELHQKNYLDELEKLNSILDPNIIIFSDYIENKPEKTFSVYSFLVTDDFQLHQNAERLSLFREENKIPANSFFDYKKVFQDNQRKRLLPEYLKLTEKINGLLFTVFIDKKYVKLLTNIKLSEHFEHLNFGTWKPHILAEMLITFSILAFILSKITSREVTWLTDEDSRMGNNNDKLKLKSLRFLQAFLMGQGIQMPSHIFIQKDSEKLEFQQDRDVKSIVDLAAGSINDFIDLPEKVRDISRDYFKWFDSKSGNLYRKSYQFYFQDNSLRVIETTFKIDLDS